MSDITAEITVVKSVTAEVTVDRSAKIQPISVTGQSITANQATEIDTGQSDLKPKHVSFYDEVGNKNIDNNLPGWSARLDGTWFIDIPATLLEFSNITVYYS